MPTAAQLEIIRRTAVAARDYCRLATLTGWRCPRCQLAAEPGRDSPPDVLGARDALRSGCGVHLGDHFG